MNSYVIPGERPGQTKNIKDGEVITWLYNQIINKNMGAISVFTELNFKRIREQGHELFGRSKSQEFHNYISYPNKKGQPTEFHLTLLHIAALFGDIDTLDVVLYFYECLRDQTRDVLVKEQDPIYGYNLLHLALINNSKPPIEAILRWSPGAANVRSASNKLPIEIAFETDRTECLRVLHDATDVLAEKTDVDKNLQALIQTMSKEQEDHLRGQEFIKQLMRKLWDTSDKKLTRIEQDRFGEWHLDTETVPTLCLLYMQKVNWLFGANNLTYEQVTQNQRVKDTQRFLSDSQYTDQAVIDKNSIALLTRSINSLLTGKNISQQATMADIRDLFINNGYRGELAFLDENINDSKRVELLITMHNRLLQIAHHPHLLVDGKLDEIVRAYSHYIDLIPLMKLMTPEAVSGNLLKDEVVGRFRSISDMELCLRECLKIYQDVQQINQEYRQLGINDFVKIDLKGKLLSDIILLEKLKKEMSLERKKLEQFKVVAQKYPEQWHLFTAEASTHIEKRNQSPIFLILKMLEIDDPVISKFMMAETKRLFNFKTHHSNTTQEHIDALDRMCAAAQNLCNELNTQVSSEDINSHIAISWLINFVREKGQPFRISIRSYLPSIQDLDKTTALMEIEIQILRKKVGKDKQNLEMELNNFNAKVVEINKLSGDLEGWWEVVKTIVVKFERKDQSIEQYFKEMKDQTVALAELKKLNEAADVRIQKLKEGILIERQIIPLSLEKEENILKKLKQIKALDSGMQEQDKKNIAKIEESIKQRRTKFQNKQTSLKDLKTLRYECTESREAGEQLLKQLETYFDKKKLKIETLVNELKVLVDGHVLDVTSLDNEVEEAARLLVEFSKVELSETSKNYETLTNKLNDNLQETITNLTERKQDCKDTLDQISLLKIKLEAAMAALNVKLAAFAILHQREEYLSAKHCFDEIARELELLIKDGMIEYVPSRIEQADAEQAMERPVESAFRAVQAKPIIAPNVDAISDLPTRYSSLTTRLTDLSKKIENKSKDAKKIVDEKKEKSDEQLESRKKLLRKEIKKLTELQKKIALTKVDTSLAMFSDARATILCVTKEEDITTVGNVTNLLKPLTDMDKLNGFDMKLVNAVTDAELALELAIDTQLNEKVLKYNQKLAELTAELSKEPVITTSSECKNAIKDFITVMGEPDFHTKPLEQSVVKIKSKHLVQEPLDAFIGSSFTKSWQKIETTYDEALQGIDKEIQAVKVKRQQQRAAAIEAFLQALNTAIEEFNAVKQFAKQAEAETVKEIDGLIVQIKNHVDLKSKKLLGAKSDDELTQIEDYVRRLKASLAAVNPTLIEYKNQIQLSEEQQLAEAKKLVRADLEKLRDLIKTLLALNDKVDGKDLLRELPKSLAQVTTLAQLSKINIDKILKAAASKEALVELHQTINTFIEEHLKSAISREYKSWLEARFSTYQTTCDNYNSIKANENAKDVKRECDASDKIFTANIHALGLSIAAIETRDAFSELTTDVFLLNKATEMSHSDFVGVLDLLKKEIDNHCSSINRKVQGFRDKQSTEAGPAKIDYEKAVLEFKASQTRYLKITKQDFEIQAALAIAIKNIQESKEVTAKQYRDAIDLITQEKALLDTAIEQALEKKISEGLEPYRTALQKLSNAKHIDLTKIEVPAAVKNLYRLLLLKAPEQLSEIVVSPDLIAKTDDKKFNAFFAQFHNVVTAAALAIDEVYKNKHQARVAALEASLQALNTAIEQFNAVKQFAKQEEAETIEKIDVQIVGIKKHVDLESKKLLGDKRDEEIIQIESDIRDLKTTLEQMNPTLTGYKNQIQLSGEQQLEEAKNLAREDLKKLQDLIKTLLALNNKPESEDLLRELPKGLAQVKTLAQLSKINIDKILKANASKEALEALHQDINTFIEGPLKSAISREYKSWLGARFSTYQTTCNNYNNIKTNENAQDVKNECDATDKTFTANIAALGLSIDVFQSREVFSDLTTDLFLPYTSIDMSPNDFRHTIDRFKKYVDDHNESIDQKVQGFVDEKDQDLTKAKTDYDKASNALKALQARYLKITHQNFEIQPELTAAIQNIEESKETTAEQYRAAIGLITQEKVLLNTAIKQALVKLINEELEPYRAALQRLQGDEKIDNTKVAVPSAVQNLYKLLLIKKVPKYLEAIDPGAVMLAEADDPKFNRFIANIKTYVSLAAAAVDKQKKLAHEAHDKQRVATLIASLTSLNLNLEQFDKVKRYAKKDDAADIERIKDLLAQIEIHINLKSKKLIGNKNDTTLSQIEADISNLKTLLATMNPRLNSHKAAALLKEAEQLRDAKSTARKDLEKLQDLIKTLLALNGQADDNDLLKALPNCLRQVTTLEQLSKINIDKILKNNANKEALDELHQAITTFIEGPLKSAISREFNSWLEVTLLPYETTCRNYDGIKDNKNAKRVVRECNDLDQTFTKDIQALGLCGRAVQTRTAFSDLTADFFSTDVAADMSHTALVSAMDRFKKHVDDHCEAINQKVQHFANDEELSHQRKSVTTNVRLHNVNQATDLLLGLMKQVKAQQKFNPKAKNLNPIYDALNSQYETIRTGALWEDQLTYYLGLVQKDFDYAIDAAMGVAPYEPFSLLRWCKAFFGFDNKPNVSQEMINVKRRHVDNNNVEIKHSNTSNFLIALQNEFHQKCKAILEGNQKHQKVSDNVITDTLQGQTNRDAEPEPIPAARTKKRRTPVKPAVTQTPPSLAPDELTRNARLYGAPQRPADKPPRSLFREDPVETLRKITAAQEHQSLSNSQQPTAVKGQPPTTKQQLSTTQGTKKRNGGTP